MCRILDFNYSVVYLISVSEHCYYFLLLLFLVEKRKETISDLPRQGGQKKKMGKRYLLQYKYFKYIM